MESPGPGHGHRGFLVQRNHESGGIVIVYSVPEECGFGNSATSTFCNRDIFAIPNSASVIQLRPLADKPASTPEPAGTFGSGSRTGWKLTDTGRISPEKGRKRLMVWTFIKIAILAVLAILTLGLFPDRRRGAIIAVATCIVAAIVLHFVAP